MLAPLALEASITFKSFLPATPFKNCILITDLMRPLHLSLLSFHTFPPFLTFWIGRMCVSSLPSHIFLCRSNLNANGWRKPFHFSSIKFMHHFSFEGVLQQVMVWDSGGKRGEYNLYSSKPLHSYRNCLWQGKKRKEKWKPTAAKGTRSYSAGGTVILPISCRILFGCVGNSTYELINSMEQRSSSEADSS